MASTEGTHAAGTDAGGLTTPPARRITPLATVLIVAGIVAGMCASGAAIGVGWVTYMRARTVAAPGHATDVLLSDIEADRAGTAYRRLCRTTRQNLSEREFAELIRSEPRLVSHRVVDSRVSDADGARTATVTARLTLSSGPESHTFPLVREGGAWRVCGQPF